MATAPVCHTSAARQGGNPKATKFPVIPTPTPNLDSLVQTVIVMKNLLEMLTKQRGGNDGTAAFVEQRQRRVTQTVTVKSADGSVEVDVEQINSMTFDDPNTGGTWTWRR